jgi:murein DD-endopeptidase MepM/ murein hydrolase activator NlpD
MDPRILAALAVGAAVAATATVLTLQGQSTLATGPVPGGFDFPVGAPDGDGYYDAQPFGVHDHCGNDWNGNGGADTDLGDPVTAIADGVVTFASDEGGGWGNVVRVVHGSVESLYAHLDRIDVHPSEVVRRGDPLGTIGTAHGHYKAHLHLELRSRPGLPLGGGYAMDRTGYLDPTAYILAHRPAR